MWMHVCMLKQIYKYITKMKLEGEKEQYPFIVVEWNNDKSIRGLEISVILPSGGKQWTLAGGICIFSLNTHTHTHTHHTYN